MNVLYIALKYVIWRFQICNCFCEISEFLDFMNTLRNLAKPAFAHISAKFKYFAKQFILTESQNASQNRPEMATELHLLSVWQVLHASPSKNLSNCNPRPYRYGDENFMLERTVSNKLKLSCKEKQHRTLNAIVFSLLNKYATSLKNSFGF